MPGEDRTEQATPRRREDARKRGQVAKSADLNAAVGILACLLALQVALGFMGSTMFKLMTGSYRALADPWSSELGATTWLMRASMSYFTAFLPVLLTAAIAGLVINLSQVGFLLTAYPLIPKLSKLDPVAGLGRMFSQRSLAELAKAVAKAALIGYIGYVGLRNRLPVLLMMSSMEIREALAVTGGAIANVALRMGIALLVIGALDYVYQRVEFEKSLRMTKQEVREELRQQEGDPLMRSRIRQRQRQMAMRRMMHDVKTADVVITNPVHYAVALKYEPEKMRAPRVVAKGQRLIAQRIKEIAREHKVPIVENKPVAQTLFKAVGLGQEIPPELYKAVAEILAMVYRFPGPRGV